LVVSRVIAEVHREATRPFRVIAALPSQAREIDTLELSHDLADENQDAMPEVEQIFDRAAALQPSSDRPIVVLVEDTHVKFFDQV
jgi:hypothetical protein